MITDQLAPALFGHHPDLSTDFCCEVELLQGWIVEIIAGLRSQWPFWSRLSRCLRFCRERVGDLDECGRRAVPIVPTLERRLLDQEWQPRQLDGRYA